MKTKGDLFIWKPTIKWRDLATGWWTIKPFPYPALPGLPLDQWWKGQGSPNSDACVFLGCFSHVPLFATPLTVACQAPPSMEISKQKYWSGLLFPPPGGMHWQASSLTLAQLGNPSSHIYLEEKKRFKQGFRAPSDSPFCWVYDEDFYKT